MPHLQASGKFFTLRRILLLLLAIDPLSVQAQSKRGSVLRLPPTWEAQPSDQLAYPQILAVASRGKGPDRAVMTLVVRHLPSGTSVQQFAQQSLREEKWTLLAERPRLQVQPIEVGESGSADWGTQRVELSGKLKAAPPRVVRQLFYVHGDEGYLLTLIAPEPQAVARIHDLEDTAATLRPR